MKLNLAIRMLDGEHISTLEPIKVADVAKYKAEIASALETERFLEIPISKHRLVSVRTDQICFLFFEELPEDLPGEETPLKSKDVAEEEIRKSLKEGRRANRDL